MYVKTSLVEVARGPRGASLKANIEISFYLVPFSCVELEKIDTCHVSACSHDCPVPGHNPAMSCLCKQACVLPFLFGTCPLKL